MDELRMDQIARALASGASRRSALKGIAVALGISATGALTASTAAAPPWCACTYACGAGGSVEFCAHHCQPRLPGTQGSTSCTLATATCDFPSEQACYASFPI